MLLKKLLENLTELVDKHCGRLRYDFHRRLQEIARDYRQIWLAKVDDTTRSIRQALERARAQKQSRAEATTLRVGELDQRLKEILQAETQLLAFKDRLEGSLP